MKERFDHAARALEAIGYIEAEEGWMKYAPHATAVATAHATLALVEQQRVMNDLKLDELRLRAQSYEPPVSVREALGL